MKKKKIESKDITNGEFFDSREMRYFNGRGKRKGRKEFFFVKYYLEVERDV